MPTGRTLALATGAAALAAVVVVWIATRPDAAPRSTTETAAVTPSTETGAGTSATSSPGRDARIPSRSTAAVTAGPTMPGHTGGSNAVNDGEHDRDQHIIDIGAAGSLAVAPQVYVLDSGGGAPSVNLAGGPSRVSSMGDGAHGPTVGLRGSVVDPAGRPVPGAIVILGAQISIVFGHLSGSAATTTDGAGRFTIDAPKDAGFALALDPRGWSSVVPIDTGATAPLSLKLVGRGALHGRLRYGGRGDVFAIRAVLRDRPFTVHYQSNPDGQFEIASLPPGSYVVSLGLAQTIAGGSSQATERVVTIEDGKTAELVVDQRTGATIVVAPRLDARVPDTLEYWLVTGPAPTTAALAKADQTRWAATPMLFGGMDAAKPMEFHDVAPGSYQACVSDASAGLFGCAGVAVSATDSAREVEVALAAAKP